MGLFDLIYLKTKRKDLYSEYIGKVVQVDGPTLILLEYSGESFKISWVQKLTNNNFCEIWRLKLRELDKLPLSKYF